jgi:hypothetical protein
VCNTCGFPSSSPNFIADRFAGGPHTGQRAVSSHELLHGLVIIFRVSEAARQADSSEAQGRGRIVSARSRSLPTLRISARWVVVFCGEPSS